MTSPYNSTERLVRYQDIAAQAHARGFTSEAKRKEALDFVNRAYDTARGILGRQLQADFPYNDAKRSWPEAYLALSDVAPYDWTQTHRAGAAGEKTWVAL